MNKKLTTKAFYIISILMLTLYYAGYVFLAQNAYWNDEYADFYSMDIGYYIWRLWYWSPRPSSEFFIYIYGLFVQKYHLPLAVLDTYFLWSISLLLALSPALIFKKNKLSTLLISLTLFLSLFAGAKAAEILYWPIACAAYLTSLGGLIGLFWLSLYQDQDSQRFSEKTILYTSVSLEIFTAGCYEISALIILVFSSLQLFKDIQSKQFLLQKKETLIQAIPACFSFFLLYRVFIGRMPATEGTTSSSIVHTLWITFINLFMGFDYIFPNIFIFIIIATFIFCTNITFKRRKLPLNTLFFIIASIIGMFFMILVTAHKFSDFLWFNRYGSFLNALRILTMTSLATLISASIKTKFQIDTLPFAKNIFPAVISIYLVCLGIKILPIELIPEIKIFQLHHSFLKQRWKDATATGNTLIWHNPPPSSRLWQPVSFSVGHYFLTEPQNYQERIDGIDWPLMSFMNFFQKKDMIIQ